MTLLFTILAFVVALGILVAVHEFGHYWVARKLGVKVLRFSIGFGRTLWKKKFGKDNTEFVIAALPLGGYVKMLDENEGEVPEEEKHRAFNRQPLAIKVAVVTAGPAFNLLFAVLAYWIINISGIEGILPNVGDVAKGSIAEASGFKAGDKLVSVDGRTFLSWGQQRLYLLTKSLDRETVVFEIERTGINKNIEVDLSGIDLNKITSSVMGRGLGLYPYLPPLKAIVGTVLDGPAKKSGLQEGDLVIRIDTTNVNSWNKLVEVIQASAGEKINLTYMRDGRENSTSLTPESITSNNKVVGRINITPQVPPLPDEIKVKYKYNVIDGLTEAANNTYVMSALTLKMLYKMLTLEISSKNISGPITIAQYAGYSAKAGIDKFLMFLAIVSISLGILNLLPIPVLDGGHLLYYLIEAVKGSPLSEKTMYVGQQLGILMLIGLMILAFYNDIIRLI